jgi:hypothetical protein
MDITIRNPTDTALPIELIDVYVVGTLGGSKHGILQVPANRAAAKVNGVRCAACVLQALTHACSTPKFIYLEYHILDI